MLWLSRKKKTNAGFTLLEFLIYIAIIGPFLVAAGAIGINILFGKAKLTATEEVHYNARFTIEKMLDTIRNAESINAPGAP